MAVESGLAVAGLNAIPRRSRSPEHHAPIGRGRWPHVEPGPRQAVPAFIPLTRPFARLECSHGRASVVIPYRKVSGGMDATARVYPAPTRSSSEPQSNTIDALAL